MSNPLPPALLERLQQAERIVIFTGAGVSAESGVPTFRDARTGLWARYDPEQLATALLHNSGSGQVAPTPAGVQA